MPKHIREIINNPFWYIGGKTGERLFSHRHVGNMPKYQIMLMVGDAAVLDILPDDFKAEKVTKIFDSVQEGDALKQAMEYAEKYEAKHSQS